MVDTLDKLLTGKDPVDLDRIEESLSRFDERNADLDAALTGLVWRRRTQSALGLIATLVREDCVVRRDRIPEDLERIGARQAADCYRKLRSVCAQNDIALGSGVIDRLDTDYDFAQTANRIEQELDDIAPKIWCFLRARRKACEAVPLAPNKRGFLRRLLH